MASATLYPPIVDSYTAAFVAEEGVCRVYYSLSKFSRPIGEIKSIHFSIVKQDTGMSVVRTTQPKEEENYPNNRFWQTGILVINVEDGIINQTDSNLYYTDIIAADIKNNWTPGWTYKIQVRFSSEAYDNQSGLAAWLNQNANNFSEWSTYTITKAIAESKITTPIFKEIDNILSLSSSTLEFIGSYSNDDNSEVLYSYSMQLIKEIPIGGGKTTTELLESTGLIEANQYTAFNQFYYLFKTNLEAGFSYILKLEYETINKYKGAEVFKFEVKPSNGTDFYFALLTAEDADMESYSSIEAEESEGRIALKLKPLASARFVGKIYIRRSDMRTNFMQWEDIKVISVDFRISNDVKAYPIIYDYTAESGTWYKYGIQSDRPAGPGRSGLKVIENPIKREFDYSYLLGKNGQQLKLQFDNTMNSFKTAYSESKIDTIGSQFPFITRNGNTKYKTFPINGLISFNMDDNNLFITKEDVYGDSFALYEENKVKDPHYDYTYEREFRKKVLEFLEDSEPKLFKSPTEGNIIVRLMEVNSTPNTTLSRLISSFTSNAYEIDEPTVENYKKYKFLF